MADQWYFSRQGKDFGPVNAAQLKQLAGRGQLQPTDEVWKAGMAKRVPARAVKGLFGDAAQPGTATATAPPPSQPANQRSTVKSSAPTPPPEEELVELIADDPQPQYYAPPQQPYMHPQVGYTAPMAPGPPPMQPAAPMHAEVIDDELEPIDEAPRPRKKKKKGGSSLGLWLGIGGGALALVAILVVVLILVLGGGGGVNEENFKKLKQGMSENEITAILGSPSQREGMQGIGEVLHWRGSGDTYIQAFMANGRAMRFRCRLSVAGGGFIEMGR